MDVCIDTNTFLGKLLMVECVRRSVLELATAQVVRQYERVMGDIVCH